MGEYSVKIENTTIPYKRIWFEKNHPNEDPDTFSLTIDASIAVNSFDVVKIYNGDTLEFYGFVEKIEEEWNEDGHFKRVSGRCRKVIFWKKFIERFERAKLNGFFGAVNPSKLIWFLLFSPISDDPTTSSPFHRLGYGIDLYEAKCSAIRTVATTHPNYVKIRQSGFAWQLGFRHDDETLMPDSFVADDEGWGTVGTSPWINSNDDDTSYIEFDKAFQTNLDNLNGLTGDTEETNYEISNVQSYESGNSLHCWRTSDVTGGYVIRTLTQDAKELRIDFYVYLPDYLNYNVGEQIHLLEIWGTGGVLARIGVERVSGGWEYFRGYMKWNNGYDEYIEETLNETMPYHQWLHLQVKIKIDSSNGYFIFIDDEGHEFSVTGLDNDDRGLIDFYKFGAAFANEVYDANKDYDVYIDQVFSEHLDKHFMSYFTIQDPSGWRENGTSILSCTLYVYGKFVQGGDKGGNAVSIRVYISTDGGATFPNYVELSWTSDETSYTAKQADIGSIIDSLSKLQNVCLKFEFYGKGYDGSEADIRPRISYAYIYAVLEETPYQRTGDWFKIDLGSIKSNVYAILIECRKNTELYPRNYAIDISTDDTVWITKATKSNNTCRDILEVWEPTDVRYIRIRITADADYGWEISQIFVWQAGDTNYRVVGYGEDQIPYENIHIDDFGQSINPISFSFMRLSEAISKILKLAHESYVPWEWWIPHQETPELYVKSRRGSDKSSTVIFEGGKHFKNLIYTKIIRDTIQRVRVIGKSEGRKQETTAISDWKVDSAAISQIGTFYEKIISNRSVDNKEAANTFANVFLKENAYPIEEITFTLGYDEFEGQYDVGDDVKVIDSRIGLNGTYRIHRIEKEITGDKVTITITLSNRWKDIADEWAEIRRELREAQLAGTITADWFGEGSQQNKIDAEQITDIWSVTAKNDEKTAPKDETDPTWTTLQQENGNELLCNDDWFVVKGHKVANMSNDYYVYINEPNIIPFDKNPKFVMEIKIPNDGTDLNNPTTWRVDDEVWIRMFNHVDKGFGFSILRTSGSYELYAVLNDAGGFQKVRLQYLEENIKYRIEAEVDWDAKVIKYKVDNELKGILAFDDSETGSGTNMYPLHIIFHNSQPDPISYYPQIYIYRYKSQWVWTK